MQTEVLHSKHRVVTLPNVKTLIEHCLKRNDNHAKEVHFRLSIYSDLVPEEAIHHVTCMTNFRLWMPSDKKGGCSIDSNMSKNFKKKCAWLKKDTGSGLQTLQEVHLKI